MNRQILNNIVFISVYFLMAIILIVSNVFAGQQNKYSYNSYQVPDVCFFPAAEARWDGYKVKVKEWKDLDEYQKGKFVSEGAKEIERIGKLEIRPVLEEGASELIGLLNKIELIATQEVLDSEMIWILRSILNTLGPPNYQNRSTYAQVSMIMDQVVNPPKAPEVEFSKIYIGYIDSYQKDGSWILGDGPPKVGEIKGHIIYAKYTRFPDGKVMLTDNYPLDKGYKIISIKEINSFLDNMGCVAHYYEIAFTCIK